MSPTCYLCGSEATTRDHVPPKTLFAPPRPNNLITVPACLSCNTSYSRDEEYFRNNVVAVSNFTNAGEVWEMVRRSYLRRPAIHSDLLGRTFPIRVGISALTAIRFEKTRTNRVLEKIAKGLVYHHYGRRLPEGTACEVYLTERAPQSVLAILPRLPCRGRFGSTFSYIGGMAGDKPNTGMWLLIFYVSRVFTVSFGLSASKGT